MALQPQFSNNSNNFDVNNNPIYSPTSNEYDPLFQPQTDPFDDIFESNYFNQDRDDYLLPWLQSPNNAFYNLDNLNLPRQIIEPPNPNNHNEAMTTRDKTQMPVNPEVRVKKVFFRITKKKHKLIGRRKKNRIYGYPAKHTKFETKNILTKNKKGAYNNFLEFFNKSVKDSKDEEIKKRKIKLRKIDNSVIGVCSKNDNLNLIKMKMKDILSHPLSNNHKRFDKNYNKKEIDFILGRKDKKLISILNKDFEDVIRIYANVLVDKDFDGFKTIEDEVKKIKDNPKDDLEMEYIKTYTKFAKNFKRAYQDIDERVPRRKKLINFFCK